MTIKFVKKDCWVGLYFDRNIFWRENATVTTTYYLCIVPCFPIIWQTEKVMSLLEAAKKYQVKVGEGYYDPEYIERAREYIEHREAELRRQIADEPEQKVKDFGGEFFSNNYFMAAICHEIEKLRGNK